MTLWELYVIIGLVCLICEMVLPSMFFLNLAFAGFVTALIALTSLGWIELILIFACLSILFIILLRPVLLKNRESKLQETGMEGKYIGKIVRVIEPIGKYSGAITIYDERWEARIEDGEEIPVGCEVKIAGYDSLVLKVERV